MIAKTKARPLAEPEVFSTDDDTPTIASADVAAQADAAFACVRHWASTFLDRPCGGIDMPICPFARAASMHADLCCTFSLDGVLDFKADLDAVPLKGHQDCAIVAIPHGAADITPDDLSLFTEELNASPFAHWTLAFHPDDPIVSSLPGADTIEDHIIFVFIPLASMVRGGSLLAAERYYDNPVTQSASFHDLRRTALATWEGVHDTCPSEHLH